MKKIVVLLTLFSCSITKAQSIDAGFSSGTGAIYIIENQDKNININYGSPLIVAADIKFTPQNSFFGIKLKYLNLNASLNGDDWQNLNNQSLFVKNFEGTIENSTLSVHLEHISDNKKINIGYNFGLGQTKEKINFDKKGVNKIENEFFILNFGGIIKYSINSKVSLKFEPSFQWNDPINSLHPERYRMGSEDINLLFQFGVNYKLK